MEEQRSEMANIEQQIGQVIKSMEKMQDTEPEIRLDIGALWMACILRRCSGQTRRQRPSNSLMGPSPGTCSCFCSSTTCMSFSIR